MTIIGSSKASTALIVLMLFVLLPGWAQGDLDDIRGITLSTHRGGRELGNPDVLRPTYAGIREVGANWIAVHPYARIRKDGTVSFRLADGQPPDYWTEPIRVAHEMGMKVCVKPHLAHWRSGFSWRGEITFETEEAWRRFWTGYAAWIKAMAEACKDADLFVIGTELDRTMSHEVEWRKLIADVRGLTDAPLTFASNWDRYEKVPFWDALDYVGIQAYFPISKQEDPSEKELRRGWAELSRRLSGYAEDVGKRIVLTELGYNQSWNAAAEPWAYPVDEGTEDLQARCMAVALKAIEAEPAIVGSFLWKWFSEPRPVGRNFQLATTKMRSTIGDVWIDRGVAPAEVERLPGD